VPPGRIPTVQAPVTASVPGECRTGCARWQSPWRSWCRLRCPDRATRKCIGAGFRSRRIVTGPGNRGRQSTVQEGRRVAVAGGTSRRPDVAGAGDALGARSSAELGALRAIRCGDRGAGRGALKVQPTGAMPPVSGAVSLATVPAIGADNQAGGGGGQGWGLQCLRRHPGAAVTGDGDSAGTGAEPCALRVVRRGDRGGGEVPQTVQPTSAVSPVSGAVSLATVPAIAADNQAGGGGGQGGVSSGAGGIPMVQAPVTATVPGAVPNRVRCVSSGVAIAVAVEVPQTMQPMSAMPPVSGAVRLSPVPAIGADNQAGGGVGKVGSPVAPAASRRGGHR